MGKKKLRKKLIELEFQYGKLLVNQLSHESEMRKEAMRLDKKRKVNYLA